MNKRLLVAWTIATLFAQPSFATELTDEQKEQVKKSFCGAAWVTFFPDDKKYTAANVELVGIQHYNPEDNCIQNIPQPAFDELYGDVKQAAINAFSSSHSSFEVMVRFTLLPDQPTVVEMQVMDATPSDLTQLRAFKSELEEIQTIHSSSGTAYVVVHYRIKPTGAAKNS